MSSACGIRQVESQARAYYVTPFTYKSEKSTDLNYSILCSLASDYWWITTLFRSSFRKPKRFCSLCRLRILYSRIETARHLVRPGFFAKIYTNFKIRRWVPRVKKLTKLKTHTHTHTHTHISLFTCRSADGMFTLMCVHESLSLSLHLQTRFGSRSDPNGIQDRMWFRQFKHVCMR